MHQHKILCTIHKQKKMPTIPFIYVSQVRFFMCKWTASLTSFYIFYKWEVCQVCSIWLEVETVFGQLIPLLSKTLFINLFSLRISGVDKEVSHNCCIVCKDIHCILKFDVLNIFRWRDFSHLKLVKTSSLHSDKWVNAIPVCNFDFNFESFWRQLRFSHMQCL